MVLSSGAATLHAFISKLGASVSEDDPRCDHCVGECSLSDSSSASVPLVVTVPSMALFRTLSSSSGKVPYDFDERRKKSSKPGPSWPKEIALRNLAQPKEYAGSDMSRASADTAGRALDSFAFIVVANLRQFFKIQLDRYEQASEKARDESAAARAKDIASSFFNSIASGGQQAQDKEIPIDVLGGSSSFEVIESNESPKEPDKTEGSIVLRIAFSMNIDVAVHGLKMLVNIKSEGEARGFFKPKTDTIERVEVSLDMEKLLCSMRTHARVLVLKAVAKKDFPLIRAPVAIASVAQEKPPEIKTSTEHSFSEKMQKLALFASLELASVISSEETEKTPKERNAPRKAKRRLNLLNSGPLFAPNKRRAMSSHLGKIKPLNAFIPLGSSPLNQAV